MKNLSFKKLLPFVAAIAVFFVLTMSYFNPLIEGKRLMQGDISHFRGMSKEIVDYRAKTGEEPLWTNSMFGGMPAYQISVQYKANLIKHIDQLLQLGLPNPAGFVFLYFLGFFILLLVLGVDPWLSLAGAIAYAFSSYFFIILSAGHNSKAHAIAYMAPVLAGIILTFRKKYLIGGVLTDIFLSLEISANHLQITYYLLLIVVAYGINEFIFKIREKEFNSFLKAFGVLLVAVFLAILTNITTLWATYDYTPYTTRGKSELTSNKKDRSSGLDRDYATGWSYGIPETMTLLIPDFNGGASGVALGTKSATYKALQANNIPEEQAQGFVNQKLPMYWGTQPNTSGPVYVGAIIFFLFIFGLLIVENRYRWWILGITVISIMLSWGKNFMPFTNFFFDYIPGYSKFRAVSMTLVIAELTIPLLAIFALKKVFQEGINKQVVLKKLLYTFYVVGGICLIIALFGSSLFSFANPNDANYFKGLPDWLVAAIRQDRASMLRFDAFRSLVFIAIATGAIWAFLKNKLKKEWVVVILILGFLVDGWAVNKRYLNNDDFARKSEIENPFQPSQADLMIMKDTDPDYRVLNLMVDPFNDASTSYFHKSIGGYHGAKLRRYQELIEHQISKNNQNVLNMLNTKYFIGRGQDGSPVPQLNMAALGNAWFVDNYRLVPNADSELVALSKFEPAKTAIVDVRFKGLVEKYNSQKDTTAFLKLTNYAPNKLDYAYKAGSDQLAVFSEIYYEKGWNAYVDGKLTPHFRADYVLRSMVLPAGEHKVEFRFEPTFFKTGERVSFASSLLLIVLLLGGGGYEIWNGNRKKQ